MMPSELNPYVRGWLMPRKTAGSVAQVNHEVAVSAHKIDGLELVGELALNRATTLEAARAVAEELMPNGSEQYADIVRSTMSAIKDQIDDLSWQLRRC